MKILNLSLLFMMTLSCRHVQNTSKVKEATDIVEVKENADGTYTVTCRNGTKETTSYDQISANNVCNDCEGHKNGETWDDTSISGGTRKVTCKSGTPVYGPLTCSPGFALDSEQKACVAQNCGSRTAGSTWNETSGYTTHHYACTNGAVTKTGTSCLNTTDFTLSGETCTPVPRSISRSSREVSTQCGVDSHTMESSFLHYQRFSPFLSSSSSTCGNGSFPVYGLLPAVFAPGRFHVEFYVAVTGGNPVNTPGDLPLASFELYSPSLGGVIGEKVIRYADVKGFMFFDRPTFNLEQGATPPVYNLPGYHNNQGVTDDNFIKWYWVTVVVDAISSGIASDLEARIQMKSIESGSILFAGYKVDYTP